MFGLLGSLDLRSGFWLFRSLRFGSLLLLGFRLVFWRRGSGALLARFYPEKILANSHGGFLADEDLGDNAIIG